MKIGKIAMALVVLAFTPVWALAADVTGVWHAKWVTQMGDMEYTYTFTQKGAVLTGDAKNEMGDVQISAGKVEGDMISFTENVSNGGMEIAITYTGKIVSPDQIDFAREVGSFDSEKATAKRAK